MDNEPSIDAPWLYCFSGRAYKTQQIVREVQKVLWSNAPAGIPGNDDLGQMSSWYVWSAMGLYPQYPGRSELLVTGPFFPGVVISRSNASIVIRAPKASADRPYIKALEVDGQTATKPWLPESFVERGGRLDFTLSDTADTVWGSAPADAPPSFSYGASSSSPKAQKAAGAF
jgi:putative alpha-1,2-mannosidase